jgi:hypothetical protein
MAFFSLKWQLEILFGLSLAMEIAKLILTLNLKLAIVFHRLTIL